MLKTPPKGSRKNAEVSTMLNRSLLPKETRRARKKSGRTASPAHCDSVTSTRIENGILQLT